MLEEQLIVADQRSFWGNDIEEHIDASLQDLASKPRRAMTDDEFLMDLRSRMKATNDADA